MKKPRAKRPATRNPRRSSAIPESLVADSGIDFTSDALREAMQDLGISLVARRTQGPLRKPEVERFLKGVSGRFENAQTASHSNVEERK